MILSSRCMDLLAELEGFRDKPYDDQTGAEISHWVKGATIGYGHLIGQDEWERYKSGITKLQGEKLFLDDLWHFVPGVNNRITANVSQNQFDALVILAFNIGLNNFESSSVLRLVNNPSVNTNYQSLEAAWKAWNKSQGRVMNGLVNRRNVEWDLYCS